MRFRDNQPISGLGGGAGEVQQKRRYAMSMPDNPEVPPTGGTVTQDMIDFADAWQALTEPTHMAYAQDEAHRREMLLMTGTLATRAGAEYVAVQDGNWTDSTTWLRRSDDTFAVPVAGAKIGVPSGITVTMNNNTTTAYGTLRVDGKVAFPINQDTKLYIDTIVVNHGGEWEQGTTVNPIPSAYTSEVEFTNGGAIDTSVDTLILGRGLVAMGASPMAPSNGSIKICGAEKDQWGTCSTTISAGATSLTLDAAPTGWAIGDEIHIAPTDLTGHRTGFGSFITPKADNVTITNISGATITFTPATTYAHTVRSETGFTDLVVHVVNFTRNIKYRSATGATVPRRGHVMLMGQNIDVRWASFDRLGRTVKNPYRGATSLIPYSEAINPSVDATNDAARIAIEGSDVPWGTGTGGHVNVRGRYSLHIHRTGTEDGQPFGEVVGCSATDAPGWAFAVHQGNCNFRKCVARQWQGAGLVAEIGSEAGIWEDCYMGEVKNISNDMIFPPSVDEPNGISSDNEKRFGYDNDFGRWMSGYWLKGRVVQVRRCVAAGCQSGFVWMSRQPVSGNQPNVNVTPEPRVFYGYEEQVGLVTGDDPIITEFDQCVTYGAAYGGLVIKANAIQNHNLRTHLRRFTAWNVIIGFQAEYTAYYTVSDFRVLSTNYAALPGSTKGVSYGFSQGAAVVSFVWEDNLIRGFGKGFLINMATVARKDNDGGNFGINNTFADIQVSDYDNGFTSTPPFGDVFAVKTNGDIINSEAEFIPAAEPVYPNTAAGSRYWLNGNIVTEFETRDRTFGQADPTTNSGTNGITLTLTNIQLMLGKYGYYTYTHPTHGASNYLLVPDLISLKLQDVGGAMQNRYLTIPLRLTGVNLSSFTNQGALPQRYVDAIALGDPGIADPGSPAAGAAAYVVYEDIFGTGNLYEGL